MKIGWIIISIAFIALIGIGINLIRKRNAEYSNRINEKLEIDINIFNETKNMSWGDTCLIINSKVNNLVEREALKERILVLRKMKGLI